jgi:hypothetical protein
VCLKPSTIISPGLSSVKAAQGLLRVGELHVAFSLGESGSDYTCLKRASGCITWRRGFMGAWLEAGMVLGVLWRPSLTPVDSSRLQVAMRALLPTLLALCVSLCSSAYVSPLQRTKGPRLGLAPALRPRTLAPLGVPAALPAALSPRRGSVMVFSDNDPASGPPRRTRKNEPDEYFKSDFERMSAKDRFGDPLVVIGLVAIFLPFIAVAILFQSGYLLQ